jgi:glyoxylase-like metal-dependent hydrolase (beta-lactamase superfamily II)
MDSSSLTNLGFRVIGVTDTISVIQGGNRSRSPFSNTVCVLDRTRMIMDTGSGHDLVTRLRDEVGIDRVVLSHSHLDHTSGTWLFEPGSGTDVSVPQEGAGTITSADRLAVRFVGEPLAAVWKSTYLPMTGYRDFTFTSRHSEGTEFSLGQNRFIALHAPGHLDDHYLLWEPDRKILVGFDIDMSPFGPWYGNYESDIPLFKKAIALIRSLPVEIYISSHARPMKGPHFAKRIAQYEATFETRDRLVLDAMPQGRPVSVDGITDASPIYNADHSLLKDAMLRFGESQMVEKHLVHMASRGLVQAEGEGLFRKAP